MFHFRLSPASVRPMLSRSARRSPLKPILGVGAALLSAWLLGHWLLAARTANLDALEADTGPIVLAMQRIGQLHTVTFNMKDVLRQESQTEPQGWVSALPGAVSVVHWATHNEALVIAEGSVEAGVDLSRLSDKDVTRVRRPDGTIGLRVHLPPVSIYPPNVHLRVVNDRPGPFWRDNNIVPKAQARAARMFRQGAAEGGIRVQAQENAIRTLQEIEQKLGRRDIEFTF